MRSIAFQFFLILPVLVLVVPSPCRADLEYTMGEHDGGAANGAPLAAETSETNSRNLLLNGAGGSYSNDVPTGGSTLSASFDGGGFYTGEVLSFYDGIDLGNFILSFDAKPTSISSFHIAVAVGRYGGGAAFIYTTGENWRFHVNGQGDLISGGAFTLGEWHHIELSRSGGLTSLHVNGVLAGTTPNFPAAVSDDFSIGAAKNGGGGPDGLFLGLIDNVLLRNDGDSDNDGLPDGWETANSLNPNSAAGQDGASGDPDGDQVSNLDEFTAGSDPQNQTSIPGDIDGDGLADDWEITNFGSLAQTPMGDLDGDLVSNDQEEIAGTDPNSNASWPDADADGLNDAWEILYFRATPEETAATILAKHAGTDDPDGDGFDNLAEQAAGSNPALATSQPSAGLSFKLGEDDAGATAGSALKPTTSEKSAKNLQLSGAGGTYSSDVPAGGASSLSAEFTSAQFYTGAGRNFFNGIDWESFSLSFDALATSATSFHIAVALGRYGQGSAFIYTTGDGWRFHINGQGDRITGTTFALNTWHHIELRRSAGEVSLFVDGQLEGTTDAFPAAIADDFSIAAAKNGAGNPDGRFLGRIDNVVLSPLVVTGDADGDGMLDSWETANGLDPAVGSGADGAEGDPDNDGQTNFHEFAFGGAPRSVASRGVSATRLARVAGTDFLAITFACRAGAAFAGAGPAEARQDGLDYSVRGSAELRAANLEVIEVIPALTDGLPSAPEGYAWRTFRLVEAVGVRPRSFLEVRATEAP